MGSVEVVVATAPAVAAQVAVETVQKIWARYSIEMNSTMMMLADVFAPPFLSL
jgi:hypothetical protein